LSFELAVTIFNILHDPIFVGFTGGDFKTSILGNDLSI
jgi:hypothetical protein